MAAKSRGLGSNRVLGKLKLSFEKGDYYEAHQMYRTLYFRYLNQSKYDEIITLLFEGSMLFFEHKQHNSGADLAILLVEALTKSKLEVADSHVDLLSTLFEQMAPQSPERLTFLNAALRWSAQSNFPRGHPRLHQKIALVLWKEKNYSQARYHFLHSSDGNGCATMLIEYHTTQGYPNEVDLFIAQAVLQYLCLKNKTTASVVFWTYIENHPEVATKPPFLLPLLNFLWFLLIAVESCQLSVFTLLCQHYGPSLARDPTYTEYLSRIGQLFFGLPPSPPKCQGMLGNILSSLCGGSNGLDDDDFPQPGPSTSSSFSLSQPDELD